MLLNSRSILLTIASAIVLIAGLPGCPTPPQPNVVNALLVSTTDLDFGEDINQFTITVRKTLSSRPMPPLQVRANNLPWIQVDFPGKRVSTGPNDPITVVVSVIRSEMDVGVNGGQITLFADGIVPVPVTVSAVQEVVAGFTADNQLPFVSRPVQFQNDTELASGAGPITSFMWDFGDGTTSTEENPVKVYDEAGLFTVSLTVTTATETASVVKADFIEVRSPIVPEADFDIDPREGFVGIAINFIDLSNLGSATASDPGTSFLWEFGDGETSTDQSPVHIYQTPGVFDVTLTVTTAFGTDSLTMANAVTIDEITPPTVDFFAEPRFVLEGETVSFAGNVLPGSLPILGLEWDFGDGTTSTEENPSHVYNEAGEQTVSLTVTTELGDTVETKPNFITVGELNALDRYVRTPDPNFSAEFFGTSQFSGSLVSAFELTSQAWRSAAEIYRIGNRIIGPADVPVWTHNMVVFEPNIAPENIDDTALLFISGGDVGEDVSQGEFLAIQQFAVLTNSVAVLLEQVPNQPIEFSGFPLPVSEDDLIAFTFDQFLTSIEQNNRDETWPLLLPMVKSAVAAMNATQAFIAENRDFEVADFIVSGASKRGWTTWLTAAADPQKRVKAVMPLVIDFLNNEPSLRHHIQVYGQFSDALDPYTDFSVANFGRNIFGEFDTAPGRELTDIVDPFEYRRRLIMPKFIVNATGDEFFVSDSAQFYFSQLQGPKWINYATNVGHGLGGVANQDVSGPMLAFFNRAKTTLLPPTVDFTFAPDNSSVTVQTDSTPAQVLLWTATDDTGPLRDFRENLSPPIEAPTPVWTSQEIFEDPGAVNQFTANVDVPVVPSVWTAYFVQVRFANPEFVFSTEIRVVPDQVPFPGAGLP